MGKRIRHNTTGEMLMCFVHVINGIICPLLILKVYADSPDLILGRIDFNIALAIAVFSMLASCIGATRELMKPVYLEEDV